MNTGIVAALPFEARVFRASLLRRGEIACLTPHARLVWAGIGAANAVSAAGSLVKSGSDTLISWGVAGGLDGNVAPGDLIIPRCVYDTDGVRISTDAAIGESLCKRLAGSSPCRTEPIVETHAVLRKPEEKIALGKRTGAVAVDMETAAIARFANRHGITFVAVRAVVDDATRPLPGFIARRAVAGGPDPRWRLPFEVAFQPKDWLCLLRLVPAFLAARRSLRRAAPILVDLIDSSNLSTTPS